MENNGHLFLKWETFFKWRINNSLHPQYLPAPHFLLICQKIEIMRQNTWGADPLIRWGLHEKGLFVHSSNYAFHRSRSRRRAKKHETDLQVKGLFFSWHNRSIHDGLGDRLICRNRHALRPSWRQSKRYTHNNNHHNPMNLSLKK